MNTDFCDAKVNLVDGEKEVFQIPSTRKRPPVGMLFVVMTILWSCHVAGAAEPPIVVRSPDARNAIELIVIDGRLSYRVLRDDRPLFGPSPLGPVLGDGVQLDRGNRVVDMRHSELNESFEIPWGKSKHVTNRCARATVTVANAANLKWQVELCAYNDGVAFRYRLLQQAELKEFTLRNESTRFDAVGDPVAIYNTLSSFTSSHESLYERTPLTDVPVGELLDCPLLLLWPGGPAAAITEARVRNFAGMYLERDAVDNSSLRCRLSPLPSRKDVSVTGETPHESPWRVVLLADVAGKLLESNLLLCLNDPPQGDFKWAVPGKTTFHWWYGEFEDDYKLAAERDVYVARHRDYIDFCARNGIVYHAVSGDGMAWYKQSKTGYGTPVADADVRIARPELGLPDIFEYARQKNVGMRLWVHWKPLREHLDEALEIYQQWGVKGLMVDFLDRDDQEMIEFTDRLLESAARHQIHIQIHGSSKYSGEQRTFPNLFNREGVLNLEYIKWSDRCTPAHNVNVAYTRALTGPVDYHHGGFRSVSRAEFQPRDRAPVVMGTRCHNMALYVVYENPMPMVADSPNSYEGQMGFDFIRKVPTTWDETRFLAGEPGEYIVIARRSGRHWYLGGMTNWTSRTIDLPLDFLNTGEFQADIYVDGSQSEAKPNEVRLLRQTVNHSTNLAVPMAPGGGFAAILSRK